MRRLFYYKERYLIKTYNLDFFELDVVIVLFY